MTTATTRMRLSDVDGWIESMRVEATRDAVVAPTTRNLRNRESQ